MSQRLWLCRMNRMSLPVCLNLANNGRAKNVNYPTSEEVCGRQGVERTGLAGCDVYHLPLLKIRGTPPLPHYSTLISGCSQQAKMV